MAIVKVTKDMAEKAARETDWVRQDALSDIEIARQIADNPDAAPLDSDTLRMVLASAELEPGYKVRLVRRTLGLSQAQFAKSYGIPLRTLQNWEQGAREPDEAAMALLKVIAYRPDVAREALSETAA